MKLTVVSNPAQGGEVSSNPDSLSFTSGEYYGSYTQYDNVTLTAVAKPGYRFVNWTGDVAEIEDTTQRTIVVAMGKYYSGMKQIGITANFEKTGRFPWEWLAGGIVALILAVLSLAIVVRRRKGPQADTEAP